MITVPMSAADLRRTRFAYSPLAEVAESLHMITSGRIHFLHRAWFSGVREALHGVDMGLLAAIVPPRPFIADFLFTGASDTATTIEDQLKLVAGMPAWQLRREVEEVWQGEPLPAAARKVVDDPGGPGRVADALWRYWCIAVEPHWRSMRAILDEDVAFRATALTNGGLGAMLAGLHETVTVAEDTLHIDKPVASQENLAGVGMVLVPSVFVWPKVIFAIGQSRPCTLTYAARGVGNLWSHTEPAATGEDPLTALIGRSRAAILTNLALPMTTTELAIKLGQSPPAVSQHLAVLRRSSLATSWRTGRRVLYRRTALADSIVAANTEHAVTTAGM
jgi:DNA-binding transcriptional ArsR family regulator